MRPTYLGILIAAVLALTWIEYEFWAFVGVAVAMAIGALLGRIAEGTFDPRSVVDAVRGKSSSR